MIGYLGAVVPYVRTTTVRAAVAYDDPNGASQGTAMPQGATLWARPSDTAGWAEVSDTSDAEGQFWYVQSADLSPAIGAAAPTVAKGLGTGTKIMIGGVLLGAVFLMSGYGK
ncbi:MAG: hypothetical protein WC700_17530 [Gemmatimonadaceae bacterium]|jgi:hypothetical protein